MLPIALAAAGVGALGGFLNSGKANEQLEKLLQKDPRYDANPLVAQQLGMSRTLLNARMPGATYAQGQIFQNEANALDAATKNATDGSQLLATGGALAGASNKAFLDLADREAQDYQRRYANVQAATGEQVNEDDKVFQDKVRRLQDEANIRGQQSQNRQNVWNSLTNLGMAGLNLSASR